MLCSASDLPAENTAARAQGIVAQVMVLIGTAQAYARRGVRAATLAALSRQVLHYQRALLAREAAQIRAALKANMLSDPVWRARVLQELGGAKALHIWRKARARFTRRAQWHLRGQGALPYSQAPQSAPLQPPERLQREQRLADRRDLARLKAAHPPISYGRVRTDADGQFRLAPIPRALAHRPRPHRTAARGPARRDTAFQPIALLAEDFDVPPPDVIAAYNQKASGFGPAAPYRREPYEGPHAPLRGPPQT